MVDERVAAAEAYLDAERPRLALVLQRAVVYLECGVRYATAPYRHFNIETGVDPFDSFKIVDTGDATISPGDTKRSQDNIEDASMRFLSRRPPSSSAATT